MNHILKFELPTLTSQSTSNHDNRKRCTTKQSVLHFAHHWFKAATLLALWSFSSLAHAATAPIYTSFLNNKAVGGYDVVSYYQDDGKPVKGNKKYLLEYKGADWYFSSQENLDTFRQEPEKYAPQYGGYCAYALASGETVKGDPLQYHIHNDKLYLNINAKYKGIWLNDKLDFIAKGDSHWPDVLK